MDFFDSIMKDLNANMAAGKRTLSDLMDGDCSYRMRDGSVIEVPMEQLQRIWDVCDDGDRLRLKLPIYVGTDVSCETPAWKVEGVAESAIVAKLLDKKIHREGYLRLYHPDLKQLKMLIPDCYIIVFTPC